MTRPRSLFSALAVMLLIARGAAMPAYAEIAPLPSAEAGSAIIPDLQSIGTDSNPVRLLTLEQCIELALQSNPALQVEREKIVELENEYRIASSGLYPRVSASAYYTRVDQDRVGVPPDMTYERESLGQLKLKQIVFDGGRTWYGSSSASHAREAQRESAEAARLDTVFAVNQAFYRVLEARELLRVGERSRSQREAFFKLTNSYFNAGKATRLESLKAEAQLLDAERTLVQAGEAHRISLLILKRTLGIGMQTPVDIADGLPDSFPEPGNEELLLAQLHENNPDLKRSAETREQARLFVKSARGPYFPEISLQGTYGYRERDRGGAGDEWVAGAFLEWSLFEGGLTRGQVGKARARYRQAEWSERAVRDQVQVDFRQAIGDVRTALASMRSSRRLIEAQDEAYKAALEFYKRGRSTYIEVLTAETDLTQARAAYVRAVGEYQSASARLDRVVGKK